MTQSRPYAYLDSEAEFTKSFGTGRTCQCGTVLSRYNPGDSCSTCTKPDATTMRIDASRQKYEVEAAKIDDVDRIRRQRVEDATSPPKPKRPRKPRRQPATVTVITAAALEKHFAGRADS
jgi:hypothetical protein